MAVTRSTSTTKVREHPFLKKSVKPNEILKERKAKVFEIVSSEDKRLLDKQAKETMTQREARIREALKKKPGKVRAEKTYDEMDDIDPDDTFLDPDRDYTPEPDPSVKPKKKKKSKTKDLVKRKELEHHDLEDVPDNEEDIELAQYGLERPKATVKKKKKGRPSAAEVEEARDSWAPEKKKVKKQKLEPGTELTIVSPGDKLTAGALLKSGRNMLGRDLDTIHELIEVGDHDTASTMIYKRMLQALLETAKSVGDVIASSNGTRGVQSMNMITSSIRDVMIDIQQAQDRGNMGVALVEKVIMPAFLDIGMMLLRENEQLKQKLRRDLSKELMERYEQILESYDAKVGDFVQAQFKEVREETRKFLQR
ncbi:hypothetical protein D3C86_1392080 [compost metagenome]